MKETILNLWQESGTLSMLIQDGADNEITYNTEVLKFKWLQRLLTF